jgi:hypothetical protein
MKPLPGGRSCLCMEGHYAAPGGAPEGFKAASLPQAHAWGSIRPPCGLRMCPVGSGIAVMGWTCGDGGGGGFVAFVGRSRRLTPQTSGVARETGKGLSCSFSQGSFRSRRGRLPAALRVPCPQGQPKVQPAREIPGATKRSIPEEILTKSGGESARLPFIPPMSGGLRSGPSRRDTAVIRAPPSRRAAPTGRSWPAPCPPCRYALNRLS